MICSRDVREWLLNSGWAFIFIMVLAMFLAVVAWVVFRIGCDGEMRDRLWANVW